MRSAWLLAGLSAAIYATLAFATGVWPGEALSKVAPTPGLRPLTPEQEAGRAAYVSEGCSYCHTQYVRPLAEDQVFGRPSVAGDYVYSTPELLGTERNGPDLTNVGLRQPSAVWNYIHLYEPRALVSQSIMPSYRWMFVLRDHALPGDLVVPVPPPYAPPHGVVVAGPQARALVAYLESLKQQPLGPVRRR